MFDARISSDSLKEIVDALKVITDSSIRISASEKGLRTRCINPANVLMVDAKVPEYAFNSYPDMGGNELEMSIDLSRLSTFVDSVDDRGENEEDIRLEYDETDNTLRLTSDYMSTVQEQVPPVNIRGTPIQIKSEWVGTARINAEDFVRAINAMYRLQASEYYGGSEFVLMGIKPIHTMGKEGTFYMEAVFDGAKKPYDPLRFEKTSSVGEPISTTKEISSLLSIDHLTDICETVKKTENIEISVGDDYPAKYHVLLPKSNTELEYIQAPRVVIGGE